MERTMISEDLTITGNLSGKAEIDVAGRIDGDVEGKSIDILASGSVSGTVKVTTALIGGRLAGSLDAKSVELQSGADVKMRRAEDQIAMAQEQMKKAEEQMAVAAPEAVEAARQEAHGTGVARQAEESQEAQGPPRPRRIEDTE